MTGQVYNRGLNRTGYGLGLSESNRKISTQHWLPQHFPWPHRKVPYEDRLRRLPPPIWHPLRRVDESPRKRFSKPSSKASTSSLQQEWPNILVDAKAPNESRRREAIVSDWGRERMSKTLMHGRQSSETASRQCSPSSTDRSPSEAEAGVLCRSLDLLMGSI